MLHIVVSNEQWDSANGTIKVALLNPVQRQTCYFSPRKSFRQTGVGAVNDLEIQLSCHTCDTTLYFNHGSFDDRATVLLRHSFNMDEFALISEGRTVSDSLYPLSDTPSQFWFYPVLSIEVASSSHFVKLKSRSRFGHQKFSPFAIPLL